MPINRREATERVSLSDVRDAYFHGDFEKCLALCDEFHPRDDTDVVEIALLRARSLLPLNRADQALEALRGLRLTERPQDEYLTSQMLIGAAFVALGQTDHGLELLRNIHHVATAAHPTVRAEISVNLARAHYHKKQYAEAQRMLDTVPKNADIVYARALEYAGWVAWARDDFELAVDRFRAALACIDSCRHYDRFVEAKSLYGLAFLCGELPRLHLWPEISSRAKRFDWTASGVTTWFFWLAMEASFITEMRGELDESTEWALLAEKLAPSGSFGILALCRLAARFGRNGEAGAHMYFISKACAKYDEMARQDCIQEEYSLPLSVAEELVQGKNPEDAAPLVTYFTEFVAPRIRGHADERRLQAWRTEIEAELYLRRGNRARAQHCYGAALTHYRDIGFLRRASIVAYRLIVLTGEQHYRDFIDEALHDADDAYWVKARIAKSLMETRLSERHVAVLRLVAEGKSNKEIADARRLSFFTARNMVRELLALLNVRTRGELAALAVARGIVPRPDVKS